MSQRLIEINTINAHYSFITSIGLFPSGKFVSISDDLSIKIWNTNFIPIQTINNAHDEIIYNITIQDENNFITSSRDKTIKFWSKKNNKYQNIETLTGTHKKSIFKIIIFSPNSFFSCSFDNTVKLWEKFGDYFQCNMVIMHAKSIWNILILNDKNLLITSGTEGIFFWNLKLFNFICSLEKGCYGFNSLTRLDNNKIIIGGDINKIMSVINITNFEIIQEIDNLSLCYAIYYLPKKKIFLTGGKGKEIRVYDSENYKCLQTITDAHDNIINGFCELKSGEIISYSWDRNFKIWNFQK